MRLVESLRSASMFEQKPYEFIVPFPSCVVKRCCTEGISQVRICIGLQE